MKRSPWTARAALIVPLLVAACDGLPGDDSADSQPGAAQTEVVRAAITDPGTRSTPQARVSMAVTNDRIFAVWQELDANLVSQVVGQEFSLTGQPVTPARMYTSNGDRKTAFAISDNGSNTFLITWTDQFNNTSDLDIWGEVVNSLGTPTTPFHINFDSTVDTGASITLVQTSSGPQWLVRYVDC